MCSLTLRCDAHLCTPWSLTPQYGAHCGAWFRGKMHTAKIFEKFEALELAVWCTPRSRLLGRSTPWSLTPLCEAHRRAWLCGVMQTANRGDWLRRCLTPRWDAYREVLKKIFFMHTSLCGMMHIAESDSSVWCTLISWQNRKRIWKYFCLFIWVPGRFESWQK